MIYSPHKENKTTQYKKVMNNSIFVIKATFFYQNSILFSEIIFVRSIFVCKNHTKILIFRCTFNFEIYFRRSHILDLGSKINK